MMNESDALQLVSEVLPTGIEQQSGTCEERPTDFMDGFVLPSHFSKPLHKIYPETIHNDIGNKYYLTIDQYLNTFKNFGQRNRGLALQ